MKFLRSRRSWIVTALAILVAVGVTLSALLLGQPGNQYRRCGHRPDIKARLLVFFPYWQWARGTERLTSSVTMHGCSGEKARGVLEQVAFMHAEFTASFGRPANTLAELVAAKPQGFPQDEPSLTRGFQVKYKVLPEGWSAYIPRQADLPGHYLAVSSGVYFCESRRPTTNDCALSHFK